MLKLVAYESSCKTTIIFLKDYEQERYDYWLNDFMSNKRVKKIIANNIDSIYSSSINRNTNPNDAIKTNIEPTVAIINHLLIFNLYIASHILRCLQ